jgi:hypothetical protein
MVLIASVVQDLALSFKLEIGLFCGNQLSLTFLVDLLNLPPILSGVIAKLSSGEQARMTTLQRELVRFVAIIACFAIAVAILIVILWAAWYGEYYYWISNVTQNSMLQASSLFPRYH